MALYTLYILPVITMLVGYALGVVAQRRIGRR